MDNHPFAFVVFLAEFGLLGLPVFTAARALRFAESIKDKVVGARWFVFAAGTRFGAAKGP
jgi:hypothetical protein